MTDTDRLAAQIRSAIKGARGAAVDADDLLWLDRELGNALDALDRLEVIAAGVILAPRHASLDGEKVTSKSARPAPDTALREAAEAVVDVFLRLPASLAMRHVVAIGALRAALEADRG